MLKIRGGILVVFVLLAAPETPKESVAVLPETAQPAGDTNTDCVCAAIRAKRNKSKYKEIQKV